MKVLAHALSLGKKRTFLIDLRSTSGIASGLYFITVENRTKDSKSVETRARPLLSHASGLHCRPRGNSV
jgi:hypothetical protein